MIDKYYTDEKDRRYTIHLTEKFIVRERRGLNSLRTQIKLLMMQN